MKKYYLHNGNNQDGPFDLTELKLKGITKDTQIWYEGLSSWKRAEEIPEVNEILTKMPPPFPKSEVNSNTEFKPAKKKRKAGLIVFVVVIIAIAALGLLIISNNPNALPGIKVEVNTPKPAVITSSADGSDSGIFNARTTVKATVQNQGGDGNVLVTFYVYQGSHTYDKSKSIYLPAGQSEELKMVFEEVNYVDGEITYNVEVKAE